MDQDFIRPYEFDDDKKTPRADHGFDLPKIVVSSVWLFWLYTRTLTNSELAATWESVEVVTTRLSGACRIVFETTFGAVEQLGATFTRDVKLLEAEVRVEEACEAGNAARWGLESWQLDGVRWRK